MPLNASLSPQIAEDIQSRRPNVTVVEIIVLSRVLSGRAARPASATATVLATVLAIIASIGGVSRLLADIPPEIDGEPLHLLVEVRFAPGQPIPSALHERQLPAMLTTRGAAQATTAIRKQDPPGYRASCSSVRRGAAAGAVSPGPCVYAPRYASRRVFASPHTLPMSRMKPT